MSNQALLPFTNALVLPKLARRLNCDLVFNPADLPIPTSIPQLFLFDWPYAAYPTSSAWGLGGVMEVVKRRIKYHLFLKYIKFIDVMIAQGPALRNRLTQLYGFDNIQVVPNAVSIDNISPINDKDFGLPDGFKFLCLSRYYSHKNIEIFVELAELVRTNNLDWKIVITIHPNQGLGARRVLEEISKRELEHIICNIGPVSMSDVPALYCQSDALLLPTLLESFSGTYVEAMFHGKPIFTSDYEFAVDVCQDAAFYFDPLNAHDIFRVIKQGIEKPEKIANKIAAGRKRLDSMPDWNQAFDAYIALIDSTLEE